MLVTYYGRFKKKLVVNFSYKGWPGTVLHTISPLLSRCCHPLPMLRNNDRDHHRHGCSNLSTSANAVVVSRDQFLVAATEVVATMLPLLIQTLFAMPSNALVKGNAPPAQEEAGQRSAGQSTKVLQCQRMPGDSQEGGDAAGPGVAALTASRPKPGIAHGGTKYLDSVQEASSPPPTAAAAAAVIKASDTVDVHCKVLKIRKSSFDGLSAKGTVIFSQGYALEDDDRVPSN